ncbi:MAG: hypothetical protein OXK77_13535 [Gemmatimonadota bacterium]|nr:hypothetical protein [Gemmatimonadota bacterium]MDE2865043.1 hypothetical protein [Gemmatimonadota bacterium]MYB07773.1 hypothetical protein [Gemmatimonadota bacterium]MYG23881.1 hypothetical protein [Gemmatimonadota bacterium]MYJ37246.1 hypothetical protein [Gemmatimonadota bacterium]
MRLFRTFPATALAIAAAGSVVAWPFLDVDAYRAVVGGVILALGTHLAAYFMLKRWRARNDRFLAAILAGFAMRIAAVAFGVFVFALPGRAEPIPFLLSLGGFLIVLLVTESAHEYRRLRGAAVPAGSGAK